MKITKKSFIENLTANNSVFLGVTKRLYTEDEVYCCIQDFLKPDVILNERACKAHANYLEFTGGSRLSFDQQGKNDFYSYSYPEGTVYICLHTYYDVWDEKDMYRAMCYLIKK